MENFQMPRDERTIKNSNKALWITGLIVALIVAGIITNGFGLITGNVVANNNPNLTLEIGNSPVLGNLNASITIYEFSDFSCPYCAAADGENPQVIASLKSRDASWQAPIPLVIENYVKTGKAKIVFKYAAGHGSGLAALAVGYGLKEQSNELFWKFHDLAFANQADTGNIDKMKSTAQSLGADMTKLNAYLSSGKYEQRMKEDLAMTKENDIQGTPIFFINGQVIEGAQSYPSFEKIIKQELAR
jgi:protein-disulfide isomerase